MEERTIYLNGQPRTAFMIPCGAFNLVGVRTQNGLVGCGAFDAETLGEKFDYPVAIVTGIHTIDDLLNEAIKKVNPQAEEAGVKAGMSGREAAETLERAGG